MADPWAITLAICVSFASFGVACAALGWNMLSWFRTGGQVKTELRMRGKTAGGVTKTYPSKSWPRTLADFKVVGHPEIIVIVRSVGRTAVTLNRVAIGFPNGHSSSNSGGMSSPLPHTIAAGGPAFEYAADSVTVQGWAKAANGAGSICAYVELADGRVKRSRHVYLPL